MDYINLLLASMPKGFWQNIIGVFVNFVGNYGLAIIIFTIALKIILSPLDYIQRKITKNNTEKQAILKPELEKLNKKYANKKELLNQKTMELYKRENYNIMGNCLGMLFNFALTLFIFISLFNAMRNISEFKIAEQYTQLKDVYQTAYDIDFDVNEDVDLATAFAKEAVVLEYKNIKDSFLWVNNVWMPDTKASIIPNYDRFLKLTKISEEDVPTQEEYTEIMGVLQAEYKGWNGTYILIILAAGVTFYSQKILQAQNKPKTKQNQNQEQTPQVNTGILLYLLPLLMVIFTISYSAAFAIYIVTNSVMSTAISFAAGKILNAKQEKENKKNKPEYSR